MIGNQRLGRKVLAYVYLGEVFLTSVILTVPGDVIVKDVPDYITQEIHTVLRSRLPELVTVIGGDLTRTTWAGHYM